MNKSKEVVEVYFASLGENYSRKSIRTALESIEACADTYKEGYMPASVYDEEFTPHDWVVASICEILESKKFWKGQAHGGN